MKSSVFLSGALRSSRIPYGDMPNHLTDSKDTIDMTEKPAPVPPNTYRTDFDNLEPFDFVLEVFHRRKDNSALYGNTKKLAYPTVC